MLDSLNKKQKIIFFSILSFMILFIIFYIYFFQSQNSYNYFSEDYSNAVLEDFSENNSFNENISENEEIIVYVCGAVKESKVLSLPKNSRIVDAIDKAGGVTSEANINNINLASILEDGDKIYVPTKQEEETNINTNETVSSKSSNKININKASQTELETLPGIGPSSALKIIEYRKDNGSFASIEEIKNVSGIGDSKFEQIKNYISVK